MEQTRLQRLVRLWPWLLILLGIIIVGSYVYGRGFIKVEVSGTSQGKLNYSLKNQETGKTTEVSSDATSISRLVPKGDYEVSVSGDHGNFFAIKTSKGFFGTETVEATLSPEKDRVAIGNNPGTCSYYVGGILYSYPCNGPVSSIVKHVPATKTQPTYTQKNTNNSVGGTIEGSFSYQDSTYLVVKAPENEDTRRPQHTVYRVGDNFVLLNARSLGGLDNSKTYQVSPLGDKTVFYTSTYEDIILYDTNFSKSERLNLPPVKDTSLKRALLGVNGDRLLVARSNKADFDNHDNTNVKIGEVKTQLDVYQGGSFKTIVFSKKLDNFFVDAEPCGTNEVCMLSNKTLYVYSTSGEKATLLFSLSGVNYLKTIADKLLVVRDDKLLVLDVAKQGGSIDYTFSPYRYCGLQNNNDTSYILCVVNPKNVTMALYVDRTQNNTDSIDKKIAGLNDLENVKSVSLYRNQLYISPGLGNPVYNRVTNSFGYDEALRKATNAKINSTIDELGIDRTKYVITNTAGY
jgi:hypothetical protein